MQEDSNEATVDNERALMRLGRVRVEDVPDMGYDVWWPAQRKREELREIRRGNRAITGIFAFVALLVLAVAYNDPTASAGSRIFACVISLMVPLVPAACWLDSSKRLAAATDPESLLPPGSTIELARREDRLISRIEQHQRVVRRLRSGDAASEEIEAALDEERALRGETLALTEAKEEIAGLLTDGDDA